MRWGEKGYPEPHKTSASPSGWSRLAPAVVWYLKHSCVWSARLGASAFRTRARESRCLFNSGSPSVSSFFCICIPNKQEIVFICMQMCLSPRLGFWIKSFTVPLIPNYTQALTWAPPPGRGVSDLPSRRISVSLGCLVCHLRNGVGIWI